MRRRQLKWLWKRLAQIAAMEISREELLMKLGAARSKAPTAWRLINIDIDKQSAALTFRLDRKKLQTIRRREGRYLLRTNLTDNDPALLWQYYIQLVAVEGGLFGQIYSFQDGRRVSTVQNRPLPVG